MFPAGCYPKSNIIAGIVYDVDAASFFTRASIADLGQKSAINQLVLDLKAASLWTKFHVLYPFVGGSASSHSFNLKSSSFQITWNGTVTHNSNGITGNGSSGYGATGYIPAANGTVNSSHLSFYCRSASLSGFGTFVGGRDVNRFNLYADNANFGYGQLYGGGLGMALGALGSGPWGLVTVSRTSSTSEIIFKGATALTEQTSANADGLAATYDCYVLADNNFGSPGSYTNGNGAFASIGLGLTAGNVSAYNTAVQTFQTSLGRNV